MPHSNPPAAATALLSAHSAAGRAAPGGWYPWAAENRTAASPAGDGERARSIGQLSTDPPNCNSPPITTNTTAHAPTHHQRHLPTHPPAHTLQPQHAPPPQPTPTETLPNSPGKCRSRCAAPGPGGRDDRGPGCSRPATSQHWFVTIHVGVIAASEQPTCDDQQHLAWKLICACSVYNQA